MLEILYSGTFRSVAWYSLPLFLRPCRGLIFRSKWIVDRAVVYELSIRVAAGQYISQDCVVQINVQISGSCDQKRTSSVGNPRDLTFSQVFPRPQMLLLPIFLLYARFTYILFKTRKISRCLSLKAYSWECNLAILINNLPECFCRGLMSVSSSVFFSVWLSKVCGNKVAVHSTAACNIKYAWRCWRFIIRE